VGLAGAAATAPACPSSPRALPRSGSGCGPTAGQWTGRREWQWGPRRSTWHPSCLAQPCQTTAAHPHGPVDIRGTLLINKEVHAYGQGKRVQQGTNLAPEEGMEAGVRVEAEADAVAPPPPPPPPPPPLAGTAIDRPLPLGMAATGAPRCPGASTQRASPVPPSLSLSVNSLSPPLLRVPWPSLSLPSSSLVNSLPSPLPLSLSSSASSSSLEMVAAVARCRAACWGMERTTYVPYAPASSPAARRDPTDCSARNRWPPSPPSGQRHTTGRQGGK
jgi:hypothetical protein